MPRLILAGLSSPLAKRYPGFRPSLPKGWTFFVEPSDYERPVLQTCWPRVLDLAGESSHGGAHIFAFHHRKDERGRFDSDVFAKHRLLWIDIQWIDNYGKPKFASMIDELIQFEEQWRGNIRPGNDSPLLLPESVFKATGEEREMWARAQRVALQHDNLDDVRLLIKRFRSRYYKRYGVLSRAWIDEEDTIFKRDPSYHGSVPAERRWKFTLEPQGGFHFDVGKRRGKEFTLVDASGAPGSGRHLNVDSHGYLRASDRD